MKKRSCLFFTIMIFCSYCSFGQRVAINTNGSDPHTAAMLDVSSTTKGMLVPRMTTEQRNNISPLASGLLVYDTDLDAFIFYMGTSWLQLSALQPGAEAGSYYYPDADIYPNAPEICDGKDNDCNPASVDGGYIVMMDNSRIPVASRNRDAVKGYLKYQT